MNKKWAEFYKVDISEKTLLEIEHLKIIQQQKFPSLQLKRLQSVNAVTEQKCLNVFLNVIIAIRLFCPEAERPFSLLSRLKRSFVLYNKTRKTNKCWCFRF